MLEANRKRAVAACEVCPDALLQEMDCFIVQTDFRPSPVKPRILIFKKRIGIRVEIVPLDYRLALGGKGMDVDGGDRRLVFAQSKDNAHKSTAKMCA